MALLTPGRYNQSYAEQAHLARYLGFLLGPILIGAAATVVTLPVALAIPVILSLFVAASAPALRPRS